MDQAFGGFEWQGRAVALIAALAVAAIGYAAFYAPPPGIAAMGAALLTAIAVLVALTRTPMPTVLRTVLMLAIICAMLGFTLRAQLVLVAPVRDGVEGALIDANAVPERRPTGSGARKPRPPGAAVSIDGLTAAEIGGPVAADVAGADAWRIDGDATTLDADRGIALSVDWRISGEADMTRCGELSVSASQKSGAYAALRNRFDEAIRASSRDGRPRCD